jgi:hypothetical protein
LGLVERENVFDRFEFEKDGPLDDDVSLEGFRKTLGSVRVSAILRGRPRLVFGIDSPPAGGTGDAVCEVRLVGRFGAA